MKVKDEFKSVGEFQELLATAEDKARNDWAREFISDITEKFEKYGEDTFVTDKQIFKLREIAE